MKKKPASWRRPGVRVNLYFDDRATLRELDRSARKFKTSRSDFVRLMLEDRRDAAPSSA